MTLFHRCKAILPLLLLIPLQAGCKKESAGTGSCAEIHKFGDQQFSVVIHAIPIAECNFEHQVGFTREDRLAILKRQNERIWQKVASLPACETVAAELKKSTEGMTLENTCTTRECRGVVNWSLYLKGLQGSNIMSRRYVGLQDGYAEAISATREIFIKAGISKEAVEEGRMATDEERLAHAAYLRIRDEGCRSALLERYRATFDSLVFEDYNPATDSSTALTASGVPASSVKQMILTQATCQFGNATASSQKCATLSEIF